MTRPVAVAVVCALLAAGCGGDDDDGGATTTTSTAAPTTPTTEAAAPTYTVQGGDTLSAIATRFGTTVAELVELNQLANPDVLEIGQVLQLPEGATATTTTTAPAATTSTTEDPLLDTGD